MLTTQDLEPKDFKHEIIIPKMFRPGVSFIRKFRHLNALIGILKAIFRKVHGSFNAKQSGTLNAKISV